MKHVYSFLYIVTLAVASLSIYNSSISPVWATSCPATQSYIVLSSSPIGYVCIESNELQGLQYSIADYKSRLDNGTDINLILTELRTNMKSVAQYNPPYGTIYAIILDRIKRYAQSQCGREQSQPIIDIPGGQIYAGFSLTPTCSIPKKRLPNTEFFINLSVSWEKGKDQFLYTGSGGSFSGIPINTLGTGKHTITCAVRPHYCVNPLTQVRKITVSTPIQEKYESHSIARIWNEQILNAIRKDQVRPPVQARNLFHMSAAFYDIWALMHPGNSTYLFGKNTTLSACKIPKNYQPPSTRSDLARAISYAAMRMILARYHESPGFATTSDAVRRLMNTYGFRIDDTRDNISRFVDATALGNAVAKCYLAYGKLDGSNEAGLSQVGEIGSHANQYYRPINPSLNMNGSGGNTVLLDWNRWQPLSVGVFIDQAGNSIPGGAATFIGAEWGDVTPFSLRADQRSFHTCDDKTYTTYLDPGAPPQIVSSEVTVDDVNLRIYKWNFELVGLWSSHLDPRDRVMIDISPRHLGDTPSLPTTFSGMMDFYDMKNGGTKTEGRIINPKTGQEYLSQIVPRGDYARVIAEFWADGPSSETPPGHWFTLLNAVSDMLTHKQWMGRGPIIDSTEWDIKTYFTLGGAMHDAAIGAWGIKGAYDAIRPVSAIRAMASRGQSSDKNLPHYDPLGLELIPGYIELIGTGDLLEGKGGANIGKVKIRAWKDPKYVYDPTTDFAGVDWILAENWWPYQRSSFVTPPFAGYVSGHSTFSRAAAEVLTYVTGDEYFPGGLMSWPVHARNYLVFEQGPSTDITLQWATYRDAANESALSRIWGGIHPPMDDIPGRILGEKIGKQAAEYANTFFAK